ncbi:hypothetical protein AAHC03_013786 [Spirometra sp. Aus1]
MLHRPLSFWTAVSAVIISANGLLIGTGIADITGPIVQINLMGYAMLEQTGGGLHLRLFSRAFIVQANQSSRPVVFVNLDAGMSSQLLKTQVLKRLKAEHGSIFDHDNVMISATHTHSGPAGFFQYALFDITSRGFVQETLDAMVNGIVQSIQMAYASITPGRILCAEGILTNASTNRSPLSYLNNPSSERSRYSANVDQEMTLLKFLADDGRELGMINWFSVHGTSMNNTNRLISSDNKGMASVLFEQWMNGPEQEVGRGPFVAAFAQANEGDVSPNTRGPRCIDTGLPCDELTSTCAGRVQNCIAFGPGRDMFESTLIIAQRQFEKAKQLYQTAKEEIIGNVDFRHQFIDMTNVSVDYPAGGPPAGKTCKPAMGYSFAAGTTDGPGVFDFKQGMLNGTWYWTFLGHLISRPSDEMVQCHRPKPILLATGQMNYPTPWQPSIVETQIFRIGQFLIAALPGEFTTMAGRRVRESIREAFIGALNASTQMSVRVVLAGLSNLYTDYVTTYEEYQIQRYEGASTAYGPHTLQAYVQQFAKLAKALAEKSWLPEGPEPPFLLDRLFGFAIPATWDWHPWGSPFGTVTSEPHQNYYNANDTVSAVFVTANPRHNLRHNGTYLTVEKLEGDTWVRKFTDANWETKFIWRPTKGFWKFLFHEAEIQWTVTSVGRKCAPGDYRIRHFGTAKKLGTGLVDFIGTTRAFKVHC